MTMTPSRQHPLTSQQLITLRSLPHNNTCSECNNTHIQPDWASVTYGILLCLDCAGRHRGLGVHLSFVRSLTMDAWSDEQYCRMIESGGNYMWKEYWTLHHGGIKTKEMLGQQQQQQQQQQLNDTNNHNKTTNVTMQELRDKYESEVARAYREALTTKIASIKNKTCSSTPPDNNDDDAVVRDSTVPRVPLPDDIPPTLSETIHYLSPFLFSMITSQRVRKYWYLWGMVGVCSAYALHSRGNGISITSSLPNSINPTIHGYMGATMTHTTSFMDRYIGSGQSTTKTNVYALGVLALFSGIPYVLLRLLTSKVAQMVIHNRQDAFKSAKNLLMERIALGRAQRMAQCDVYYPYCGSSSSGSSSSNDRRAEYGLVFYPGALVDRAAYAPIAARMSDMGILVAIVNLEPHRLVMSLQNYNLKEELMRTIAHSILLCDRGAWTVDCWAVGGHSLGGLLAITAVANEVSSTIQKIVLWGVMTYPESPIYPCNALSDINNNVQVLVVNGSKDKLVNSTKIAGSKKFENFEKKMPRICRASFSEALKIKDGYTLMVTVEGGNHAGCAHYGPQKFPIEDGVRTITLEEQQEQFAKATVSFILGVEM